MAGTIYSDTITTSALPDAMRVIYSQELEFTARPTLIFDQPAFVEQKNEFGAQRGQTVVWTIYRQLPRSIAPLTENQDVVAGTVSDYQVQFTINEYGYAIGTTEKLDLLSYHGPIGNIVRTGLAPQMADTMDTVARNMLWYAGNLTGSADAQGSKVAYHSFMNSRADRYHLATSDVVTADAVRQLAYNVSLRRVPLMGLSDPGYIALCHPAVIYDLRNDSNWKNAQLYAGATKIFNGEEGMIHGVRFLKSDRARIANGGVLPAGGASATQTTLTSNVNAGATVIPVTSAANFTPGMEVTLHTTGVSTTQTIGSSTTWTAPDGKDSTAEEVVIASISSNNITLKQPTYLPHSTNDFMTEAADIYPIILLGGVAPLGKGVAVAPEVRVSLPTDKLRRFSYIGWYGLQDYGVIRSWAYELFETCATPASALPFGF